MAKMWVPQPATRLYGAEPEAVRDKLVKEYGEGTVFKAEVGILLDLAMLTGQIKPAEFMHVMEQKLKRIDHLRRLAAGGQT